MELEGLVMEYKKGINLSKLVMNVKTILILG